MESYSNMIEKLELVKIEKSYNRNIQPKYFYNIKLEGIGEELIFETDKQITEKLVDKVITYELNPITHMIENFEISDKNSGEE